LDPENVVTNGIYVDTLVEIANPATPVSQQKKDK
jgi:preprotein translocase subunit Sec61beta